MRRAFISDLHLGDDDPALTTTFCQFCEQTAQGLDELWILGDLFDAYLGDDDDSATLSTVAGQLQALSKRGTTVQFIAGNRDFVLGAAFAARASMRICPAYTPLPDSATTLTHGDELCTDDVAYQQMRQRLRDPAWIAQALALPLATRRQMAHAARAQSREHTRAAPMQIMDVNADAVTAQMAAHHSQILIHGHTHRPAIHPLSERRYRIVLGDWAAGRPSYLLEQDGDYSLVTGRNEPPIALPRSH